MLSALKGQHPDVGGRRHFLITEVTRMRGGVVCVAGIDLQTLKIARPLQWNHNNWPESLVREGLRPGSIVRQRIRQQQNAHGYPHQSEDTQLTDAFEFVGEVLSEPELFKTLLPVVDASVGAIFDGLLVDHKYVIEATNCRSLGAVRIAAASAKFTILYNRARLSFSDPSGSYDLPVTDYRVDAAVNSGNGEAIEASIANAKAKKGDVILRLGLARAWGGPENSYDPKRCYLQINGIIFESRPSF